MHFTRKFAAAAMLLVAHPNATAQAVLTEQSPSYLSVKQLRSTYADPAGQRVNIGGVDLYFKDEGPRSAQAILMVHGSQSSMRTWDAIAAQLSTKYRVIRYDVPAMGLSGDVSDKAAKNETAVSIAKGLLDHLGVSKILFVGVSSGGTLGAFLAHEHPQLVDGLILSNMPANPVRSDHMQQPESFIRAQQEAAAQKGFKSPHFWSEFLRYFYGRPERVSDSKIQEYYDFNRRHPDKNALALVAKIGDGVASDEAIAAVKAPTLLIWGARDHLLPLSAMQSLQSKLKSAEVSTIILPDVGHYPPVEVPTRFGAIVETYIEQVLSETGRWE